MALCRSIREIVNVSSFPTCRVRIVCQFMKVSRQIHW